MSRIHEALRLTDAGRASSPSKKAGDAHQDAFTSPWGPIAPETPSEEPPVKPEPQLAAAPQAKLKEIEIVRSRQVQLADDFDPKWRERLVVSEGANPTLVEQYRRLAATLHQSQIASNTKVVLITSATPGDGKTLTAINLSLILSQSYRRRVLLIDADLRRPSIRDVSDMPNVLGLSEGLRAKTDQKLTVLQLTKSLALLPAGRPDPDPTSGLTSARMGRIIEDAAAEFDWVIMDAPPIGTVTDASLLMQSVDAALVVVRAGHSPAAMVTKAIDALGRDRVLGVVLNAVEDVDESVYGGYYSGGLATTEQG
jgi:capsular exopolysaccharide synthesis family protein